MPTLIGNPWTHPRSRATAGGQSAAALFFSNAQRVKVALLEELLDKGHAGAEYDAYTINIGEGQQFGSGFVEINPNSKIPALLDLSTRAYSVFESGAIMVYLAEKFGEFLPTSPQLAPNVCPGCSGKWAVLLPGRWVRSFLCLRRTKCNIP